MVSGVGYLSTGLAKQSRWNCRMNRPTLLAWSFSWSPRVKSWRYEKG